MNGYYNGLLGLEEESSLMEKRVGTQLSRTKNRGLRYMHSRQVLPHRRLEGLPVHP